MRFFPVFLVGMMIFLSGSAAAQNDGGSGNLPPPPSVDEYNNVPPGILMTNDALPDSSAAPDLNTTTTAAPTDETAPTPAADEGGALTMDDLAADYAKGQYDIVAKHIVPVAKGGFPQAEEMLGIMYHSGQGVPKDPQKALEWLTKASDMDRPLAEHYLAIINFSGEGVAADPVIALMWMNIAVVHYPDGADKTRAVQDRDAIASQLSRRDRETAFKMAHDWLEKKNEGALLNRP